MSRHACLPGAVGERRLRSESDADLQRLDYAWGATATQSICVVATAAPVISTLAGPTTIQCPATPVFTTPTASDACDPSPTLTFADVTTPGSCPQNCDVTRTWTATDHCGNS